MKKSEVPAMIAAFLILVSAAVCSARDAAMVIDIKEGKAYYEAGEEKGRELMLMDFPKPGDKIRLESGTVLVLNYFATGVREEITGPGKITIGNESSRETEKVRISRSEPDYIPPKSKLNREDLQQFGSSPFRDADPGGIVILRPTDNTAVRSRPVFRWIPVKGAESYHLRIYDMLEKPCFHAETEKSSFSYDKSDLIPEEIYEWTVSTKAEGNTARGKGTFTILGRERLDKMLRSERRVRERYPENSDELLVILAVIYRQYELIDEVADMIRELHHRHPRNRNFERWLRNLSPASVGK